MRKNNKQLDYQLISKFVFILIVLSFSIYAGVFIYQTSFVVDDVRYFSLFDDAMISMTYAKNFADGSGLVWNPGGERIEGYTNPLWTLYMSLLHLLPIAQSKISLFIQITGLIMLVINLYFVKKIAYLLSDRSHIISLGAVLLTAFYFPINNWSLQGMEVGLLTLLTSISLWLTLQCINKKSFSYWLYALLGVGTLVRLDMVVIFFCIWTFLVVADPKNRKKNIFFGILVLFSCIFAQTMFRIWYYNDILPNTYYLKMTGYPILLRFTRGFYVFLGFIRNTNFLLFLLPFSILFYRRDRSVLLLFWIFILQSIYSIYTGGDAWEGWIGCNRFISIVMPAFFILFTYALYHFCFMVINNSNLLKKTISHSVKYFFSFLLLMSLLGFNDFNGIRSLRMFLFMDPPYYVTENEKMVKLALLLREITSPEAKIAVTWAGTIPYYSERYFIDLLGKSDKKIAHQKVKIKNSELSRFISFLPGHNKFNLDYSISELKPDVFVLFGLFDNLKKEALLYLNNNDNYRKVVLQNEYHLFLRKDSTTVSWNKIEML